MENLVRSGLMRSTLFTIVLISSLASKSFAQDQDDNCTWEIPKTITMDCRLGLDYEFNVTCNCTIDNFELKIFDRWGTLTFHTTDIEEHWFAGNHPDSADFTWIITGLSPDNKPLQLTGSVTLLK